MGLDNQGTRNESKFTGGFANSAITGATKDMRVLKGGNFDSFISWLTASACLVALLTRALPIPEKAQEITTALALVVLVAALFLLALTAHFLLRAFILLVTTFALLPVLNPSAIEPIHFLETSLLIAAPCMVMLAAVMPEDSVRRPVYVLLFAGLVQIPLLIAQYFGAFGTDLRDLDRTQGLLNAGPYLAVALAAVALALLGIRARRAVVLGATTLAALTLMLVTDNKWLSAVTGIFLVFRSLTCLFRRSSSLGSITFSFSVGILFFAAPLLVNYDSQGNLGLRVSVQEWQANSPGVRLINDLNSDSDGVSAVGVTEADVPLIRDEPSNPTCLATKRDLARALGVRLKESGYRANLLIGSGPLSAPTHVAHAANLNSLQTLNSEPYRSNGLICEEASRSEIRGPYGTLASVFLAYGLIGAILMLSAWMLALLQLSSVLRVEDLIGTLAVLISLAAFTKILEAPLTVVVLCPLLLALRSSQINAVEKELR